MVDGEWLLSLLVLHSWCCDDISMHPRWLGKDDVEAKSPSRQRIPRPCGNESVSPGPLSLDPGPWTLVPGPWSLVPGSFRPLFEMNNPLPPLVMFFPVSFLPALVWFSMPVLRTYMLRRRTKAVSHLIIILLLPHYCLTVVLTPYFVLPE